MPQQPPQNLSTDTIKSLFEIYKVDIQQGLPLDALLHNNPQCCYLIRTASASSEARRSSLNFSSSTILMRSRITLQNTSLAMFSKMMPHQFLQ